MCCVCVCVGGELGIHQRGRGRRATPPRCRWRADHRGCRPRSTIRNRALHDSSSTAPQLELDCAGCSPAPRRTRVARPRPRARIAGVGREQTVEEWSAQVQGRRVWVRRLPTGTSGAARPGDKRGREHAHFSPIGPAVCNGGLRHRQVELRREDVAAQLLLRLSRLCKGRPG